MICQKNPKNSRLLGFLAATAAAASSSLSSSSMAIPRPYSGVSTLAFVARASALTFGVVYGSIKLSYLRGKVKSQKKAEAKGHH